MTDLVLGVGGKLAGMGLGRGVSLLFSKFVRVWRIDQALKGLEADPSVRTAISDYEAHLSITHGQYTVVVEAFHNELVRSGVADAMMEMAIVGRQSDVTEAAFLKIHGEFFHDLSDEDARTLYDKMSTSFRVSMAGLTGNPALLKFMHAFHKQINNRIDQIDSGAVDDRSNYTNLFPTIHAIAKGLQAHYKTLKVETLNGARQVNIADIYVSPGLRLIDNEKRAADVLDFMPPIQRLGGGSAEGLRRSLASHQRQSLYNFSYTELRSSFRRVVILGDPGGGKSTICQRLCFDMARATSLSLQYQGKNHVAPEDQKIPFRIILRLYEQACVSEPQLDLLSYLVRDLKHHVVADEVDLRAACGYLLSTGRSIIAFDGLDEILETSKRREYVELVTAFCNKYPLCPVVVTSRLVGYENAPLPTDFDKVLLNKFSKPEILEYAGKFLVHISDMKVEDAALEAKRFAIQTDDNASDLRRNPLMLGLMLWLFMAKGDVPSNRPAIYADCSTLMFEKWDTNRGIKSAIPSGFDRSQLFSSIASGIYPKIELRAGVSREWLTSTLVEYFSDKFVDRAKAYEAADSLVAFLVGRAWVMMEAGDGVFTFTHQTFLEYFFAKHIVANHDSVKDLFRVIRTKIVKKEHDVVNHLALQSKCDGNDRLQSQAVDEIIKYLDALSNPNSIQSVLAFSAKALEYLIPSEAVVRRILERIFAHSLSSSGVKINSGFPLVHLAIASCNLRNEFVVSEVVRLFCHAIQGEDDHMARAAAGFLRETGRSTLTLRSDAVDAIDLIGGTCKSAVVERGKSDRWWASYAWSIYCEVSEESISRFGIQIYYDAEVISGFEGLSSLQNLALACVSPFDHRYTNNLVSKADLQKALKTFGRAGFSMAEIAPVPLHARRLADHSLPLAVWKEVLSGLSEDREMFLGGLFIFSISFSHLGPSTRKNEAAQIKRIASVLREFDRKNGAWEGLNSAAKRALKLDMDGLFAPLRPRAAAIRPQLAS